MHRLGSIVPRSTEKPYYAYYVRVNAVYELISLYV